MVILQNKVSIYRCQRSVASLARGGGNSGARVMPGRIRVAISGSGEAPHGSVDVAKIDCGAVI